MVVVLLSSACAATGGHPRPFPTPGGGPPDARVTPPPRDPGSLPPSGYEVSGTALSLRGVPYRNGGADPKGFDCSGLVWYVFARHGLAVPRTVEDQFRAGDEIRAQELRAGDLVFFTTTGGGASHVGIAVGGDSFVHAPSASGVVRVERLGTNYWSSRFVGGRRVF